MIRKFISHNLDLCVGHLHIAKQVLRYLKGTITLGIKRSNDPVNHWSGRRYGVIRVMGYVNNSYAGNLENKKSITGYCFFFDETIIIRCNK